MDPQLTNDGQLYAPLRYKDLVRSSYKISKNCSTPYNEVLNMTPRERDYILEFIKEEEDYTQNLIKENHKLMQQRN